MAEVFRDAERRLIGARDPLNLTPIGSDNRHSIDRQSRAQCSIQ
jgi:hypothetical protein